MVGNVQTCARTQFLDQLMRKILLQLSLLSETPAARLREPDVLTLAPSKAPPRHPTTVKASSAPPAHHSRADALSERYATCRTDGERRNVVAQALAALKHARYSTRPRLDVSTREGRLELGRDNRPVARLAEIYGFSEKTIKRYRAEAREVDRNLERGVLA